VNQVRLCIEMALAFRAHVLLLQMFPISGFVEMPQLADGMTPGADERAFGFSGMLYEVLPAAVLFATVLLHAHVMDA
jgi:hypothetical protein